MSEKKLLPCPFCGDGVVYLAPYCNECGNAIDWSEEE